MKTFSLIDFFLSNGRSKTKVIWVSIKFNSKNHSALIFRGECKVPREQFFRISNTKIGYEAEFHIFRTNFEQNFGFLVHDTVNLSFLKCFRDRTVIVPPGYRDRSVHKKSLPFLTVPYRSLPFLTVPNRYRYGSIYRDRYRFLPLPLPFLTVTVTVFYRYRYRFLQLPLPFLPLPLPFFTVTVFYRYRYRFLPLP